MLLNICLPQSSEVNVICKCSKRLRTLGGTAVNEKLAAGKLNENQCTMSIKKCPLEGCTERCICIFWTLRRISSHCRTAPSTSSHNVSPVLLLHFKQSWSHTIVDMVDMEINVTISIQTFWYASVRLYFKIKLNKQKLIFFSTHLTPSLPTFHTTTPLILN